MLLILWMEADIISIFKFACVTLCTLILLCNTISKHVLSVHSEEIEYKGCFDHIEWINLFVCEDNVILLLIF